MVTTIVQDACGTSENAAKTCFGPNFKILMCFFHVVKNVNEERNSEKERY